MKKLRELSDAELTQAVQDYIAAQPHGAGSWRDGSNVTVPGSHGTVRLHITDRVGDQRGSERHVEIRRSRRLLTTLVYNHHTRSLIRSF